MAAQFQTGIDMSETVDCYNFLLGILDDQQITPVPEQMPEQMPLLGVFPISHVPLAMPPSCSAY